MSDHQRTPRDQKRLDAATEARRRLAAERPDVTVPELFVVRLTDHGLEFGWEIRRFGSIVLDRSDTGYLTQVAARTAGKEALANMAPDISLRQMRTQHLPE